MMFLIVFYIVVNSKKIAGILTETKIYGETNTTEKLEFKYAGGEGTDTIYYDCDTKQYENVNTKIIEINKNQEKMLLLILVLLDLDIFLICL